MLKIGDVSDNGQVRIIDEDRLCYLVESNSNGATGVRTIAKELLNEFVEYVSANPSANAKEARDYLSGKSRIDKYEYGYNSTLWHMAKMVLSSPTYSSKQKAKTTSKDTGPLQQIFYGAPGTGKSHRVNEVTEAQPEENVFRTTFHPDSDYSTFVGCYKPTKELSLQKQPILDYDSLVDKLKEYLAIEPVNITRSCALFGYDYHDSIVKMQDGGTHTIPSLVADAYKSGTTYDSTVRAGMSIYESGPKTQNASSTITYTFVPQAFTKAYIRAWQTEEPVYLVIEEINRGNCAQIFGDLFQLLDRKNGESEYPIKPDTDLGNFLAEKLSSHVDGAPEKVIKGELMILPKNLYIWATMNTSDQSLFPIDSAFKRRWDWKYIPISEGRDKNGQTCNWVIEADTQKYSWWSFVQKINDEIYEKTNSEDKKLGYYFCIANNGIITVETFVSKVLFYLWNDVFKDFGSDNGLFTESYDKFYDCDSKGIPFINKDKVQDLLNRLKVQVVGDIEEVDSEGDAGQERQYSTARFKLNGEGRFGKSRIALEALKVYANANPEATGTDIVNAWSVLGIPNMIETSETHADRIDRSEDDKISGKWNELRLHNGEFIYLTNQFRGEKINTFISAVNAQPWGMHIDKIEE